ncbi:hypothetical protein ACIGXA_33390 [Streptomyces fildesensis]|uniref:PLL-like beta propeller domain-containing protein n=1 Tax=Streptomyces fildesensis TaxID=375757 RepID=A0ABW8CHY7_9ACTN
MKSKLRAFMTVLAVLAGLFVFSGPAQATGRNDVAPRGVASTNGLQGWANRVADGPREGDGCRIHLEGPTDPLLVCGSWYAVATWADDRTEVFGLGTDSRVWHTYQTSWNSGFTPWGVLGGHDLNPSYGVTVQTNDPIIQVLGGDNRFWCKQYNGHGGWDEWISC